MGAPPMEAISLQLLSSAERFGAAAIGGGTGVPVRIPRD